MKEEFLLGNGAMALGILEAGCQIMTSYPGTPSSEILPEVVRFSKAANLNTCIEWSINGQAGCLLHENGGPECGG